MCDKILEDIEEVKRRLAALGEDANETAISELLRSFGPDYKLDHVLGIITENWDSGLQNSIDDIICATDDKSKVQCDSEKVSRHIENTQHSSMDDALVETSDASSDYNDMDYYSSFWGDVSTDNVTRSLLSPSELYGNASSPNERRNETISVPPEVEFLEENNNDPNNNLDSVQMLHELQNNSSDIENEKKNLNQGISMEFLGKPESPKPGCSKDSHDAFMSQENTNLHKETEQINALLPRFEYNTIYKVLCQNSNAKNRIELTVWNLLSENKPKAEYLPKYNNSICSVEQGTSETCKNNLEAVQHTHSKRSQLLGKRAVTLDECRKVKRSMVESAVDIADNNINQDAVLITKAKLKKLCNLNNDVDVCIITEKASEADTNDAELKLIKDSAQKTIAEERDPFTAQSLLLRPAKLTFPPCTCKTSETSTSILNPILSPAKLKYTQNFAHNQRQTDNEHSRTVDDLKQNNGGRLLFNTLAREVNKGTSGVKTADLRSFVSHAEGVAAASQNKALSDTEVGKTRLQESNCTSHSLRSISTRDVHVITSKEASSSGNKIEVVSVQENDNISQQAVPLSKINVTNVINKPGISYFLDFSGAIKDPTMSYEQSKMHHPTMSYKQVLVSHTDDKSKAANDGASMSIVRSHPMVDSTEQRNDAMYAYVTKNKNSVEVPRLPDALYVEKVSKAQEGQRGVTNNVKEKIVLSQKALQIYYKLIPMFPCIDTNYIKQLCQDYIKDAVELLDDAVLLQDLVERLLDNDQKQLNIEKVNPVSVSNTFDVNEQYANLLGIFPEADPVYLRDIAMEIYNDPDMMKQFVQSQLEKPDYPTREQYLTKKKITEQQKQYTTDFQVKQFLEIFSDPFTYFENEKRECQFLPDSVEFLKHHFSKIKVITLLSAYTTHKQNLSLTAKYLEGLNANMKSKRFYPMIQTENIPLLQECAFITHKAEIADYLAKLKQKEETEFNELKAKNALLECQCCFDDECMPSKCSTCEDGHIFCNSCIITNIDVKLADGETHIRCLVNCDCEFPLSVLQQILPPTKFSILLQKRQEAEVKAAGLEGLVSCPFCHFASIPPQEDKVFKCFNPDCMKESCRLCKEINHLPLKCNEVKSDSARLYLEERMTEALIRKCFRCSRTFFKEEGCNKMTCVCGAQMCYICDKPVTDYKHFKGQGDTTSKLCPLWSDDYHLNAAAVIKVCEETMKHIKEKNPQVEINTTALMPKLPTRRNGPHRDVANADELPAHVTRIIKKVP